MAELSYHMGQSWSGLLNSRESELQGLALSIYISSHHDRSVSTRDISLSP